MILTDKDVEQFYKIESSVYFYANKLNNLIDGFDSREDFFENDYKYKVIIRDRLYQDRAWIFDEFAKEYKDILSQEDIKIALSWKEQIKGDFFIVKQLKSYAKFLHRENKAYAVYGLTNSFDEIVYLPCMTETVFLPFKGKIVYDGLLRTQNISFGGSMKKGMQDSLSVAEAKYGLIKSLPYQAKNDNIDEDLLKYYAKSAKNRDYYAQEIDDIISKDRELEALYYREVGKSNARIFSKTLREAGIPKGYFAIISNVIVASGATKKEVEKNVKAIVPKERLGYVYIYQLKKKR